MLLKREGWDGPRSEVDTAQTEGRILQDFGVMWGVRIFFFYGIVSYETKESRTL